MNTLDFLFCHLGLGGKGWHAIETDNGIHWCGVGDRRRFMRVVAARGSEGGRLCAVPYQAFEDCRRHTDSGVLWACVERPIQRERLKAFEPRPSLILQDGPRHVAFWALHQPLELDWVIRANRRLSLHFETKRMYASASFSFRPPPASSVIGGSGLSLDPRDVVGLLPDAPDPDSWRHRVLAA